MFVWAPVPPGFGGSEEFCLQMLEHTGVLCTPGSAFGSLGEHYVRFALVLDEKKIAEAVAQIDAWLKPVQISVDSLQD